MANHRRVTPRFLVIHSTNLLATRWNDDMDPTDTIRERAIKLLDSNDPDILCKAAELLKTASDIEQQQLNTSKLDADRRKVEQDLLEPRSHLKDTLAAITPLLTTTILAGTLIFQIYQNHHADIEKRAETAHQSQLAEQARFADALKVLQSSEHISPVATLLNTFTVEPQRSEARQMALKLLL